MISADAEKNRIVLIQQLLQCDVLADFDIETKLDTHLAKNAATIFHHPFFKFE
ncbi:Uncharacterised protein [Vibrio cholerae]|uniref:Uncharacterized protein n=1 Tax=Vibrio cholerae TaxID=666 RepID=A0A656A972_VIBCL|nr:Uncharacterised protein [Vibrio cholerae]CSB83994.1 Uncharacterised protein [Vibrio cholerae]CSC11769.1 Uncharacterised protein [Vibrio cholerae]CSC78474.1 Uncharacterised protein [Vibrio cholerae]CSC81164.1 Uncharacterised protein [Vibrio cholerae]